MTTHAVVIAGGGPTGLMLAGELALARVDVAIVERRVSQALAGARAGGLHARTAEVLDPTRPSGTRSVRACSRTPWRQPRSTAATNGRRPCTRPCPSC